MDARGAMSCERPVALVPEVLAPVNIWEPRVGGVLSVFRLIESHIRSKSISDETTHWDSLFKFDTLIYAASATSNAGELLDYTTR